MKKLLPTLLIFIFSASYINAQIPNAGFENWTNLGFYEDPQDWFSFNFLGGLNGPYAITKSSDAHSGNSSVKMEVVTTANGDTVPALLLSGDFLTGVTKFPITDKYIDFTGWVKYSPAANNDTFVAAVLLYKWDAVNMVSDLIGVGGVFIANSLNNWTSFSAPISYISGDIPDSASIVLGISSGETSGTPGSTVHVDDLGFSTNVGIQDRPSKVLTLNLFPNPANTMIQVEIENLNESGVYIEFMDMLGRTDISQPIEKGNEIIYLNGLKAGNYIALLRNSQGKILKKKMISIIH